jgi:hypothetical protein
VELKDDAFLDAPDKTIPRAILLFLLNPEWERLCIAQSNLRKIGDKVKILSAYFSGIYSGLTNLPITCKANSKESFFGLIEMSYCLHHKSEVIIDVRKHWNIDGVGEQTFGFSGFTLFKSSLATDKLLTNCYKLAAQSNLYPAFDSSTGQLSLGITDIPDRFLVFKSQTPSFPREDSLIISLVNNRLFSRKEIERQVYPLMNTAFNAGVFFRENEVQKEKKVSLQVVAFCNVVNLSSHSLEEAIRSILKINLKLLPSVENESHT